MRLRVSFGFPVAVQQYTYSDIKPFLPNLYIVPTSKTSDTLGIDELAVLNRVKGTNTYILNWKRLLFYVMGVAPITLPVSYAKVREALYEVPPNNLLDVDITARRVKVLRVSEVNRSVVTIADFSLPPVKEVDSVMFTLTDATPHFINPTGDNDSPCLLPASEDIYTAIGDTVRYTYRKGSVINTLKYALLNSVCIGKYAPTRSRVKMLESVDPKIIQHYLTTCPKECVGKWYELLLSKLV